MLVQGTLHQTFVASVDLPETALLAHYRVLVLPGRCELVLLIRRIICGSDRHIIGADPTFQLVALRNHRQLLKLQA